MTEMSGQSADRVADYAGLCAPRTFRVATNLSGQRYPVSRLQWIWKRMPIFDHPTGVRAEAESSELRPSGHLVPVTVGGQRLAYVSKSIGAGLQDTLTGRLVATRKVRARKSCIVRHGPRLAAPFRSLSRQLARQKRAST